MQLQESQPPPSKKPRLDNKYKKKDLCVSWNDQGNCIHVQEDPYKLFSDEYKETDVWYTREDYEKFLMDRIRTIELLRDDLSPGDGYSHKRRTNHLHQQQQQQRHHNAHKRLLDASSSIMNNSKQMEQRAESSPFNTSSKDDATYCIRGLEPFQNSTTHEDMHSKRKIHKSTIIIEQVRQAMLGIKDPERFRFLVAPQSDLALYRAQELAAMDEQEVYPRRRPLPPQLLQQLPQQKCARRSSMSAVPERTTTASTTAGAALNSRPPTLATRGGTQSSHHHHHHRQRSLDSGFSSSSTLEGGLTRSVASASSLLTPSIYSNNKNSNPNVNMHNQTFSSSSSPSMLDTMTSNSSLFSSSIRKLQEQNARRLMEIYNQPCNTSTGSSLGGGSNKGNHLFRFSVRRDSLLGSQASTSSYSTDTISHQQQQEHQGHTDPSFVANYNDASAPNEQQKQQRDGHRTSMMKMMPMATRFHIRRDSLNHLVTSAMHR